MDWTYVLTFGLGALWMLIVLWTASAMRSPRGTWADDSELRMPHNWSEPRTENASRD